jgi:hypothetical protein
MLRFPLLFAEGDWCLDALLPPPLLSAAMARQAGERPKEKSS